MEIILHDGKKPVLLRGDNAQFEICYQKMVRNKETRAQEQTWQAEKYYASPAAALDHLLKLKVSHSDACSLTELRDTIIRERKLLTEAWDTTI